MSKELQQAVQASQDQPVRLADPDTHTEYVVLRADVYDRIQGLFVDDTPLTVDEKRAVLIRVGLRAGWDDPEMNVYNDLDPRRTP